MPSPLAFLFATPWAALAAAAGAVSLPIIIHLLNRKRFRIVPWAAMRFLLAAQKQNVRRMRLEQVLLLAVRCMLLLLLVLAMLSVTPWAEAFWYKLFPDSAVLAAMGSQRTHKILVLDGSFSMALKTADGTCFDRARGRISQILESSGGSDGFSVVLMAAPPQRIVPEPSEDTRRVAEEVQKVRLPHGNADLLATLQTVEDMVRRSPGKFEAREVYFLTDMQRSTWTGPSGNALAETLQRIQNRARLFFVDVGQDGASNVAVTALTLGAPLATTGTETPILATLHNYGGEEHKQVHAKLLIGRARADAKDPAFELHVAREEIVAVPPGKDGVTVSFMHTFPTEGDYAVQVLLEHDNLEVDDSRSLVVTVKDTVPVMLVNGKPAPRLYQEATSFLDDALNPFEKGQAPRYVMPRPEIFTEDKFANASLGDLSRFDCVFLCDVPRLGTAEVRRLETHLKRGGGVVFCLGPHVDLEAYNRLVYANGTGLLPGALKKIEPESGFGNWMLYGEEEAFKKAPLDPFLGDKQRASLSRARFQHYLRVELPTARNRTRKLLSFMPEPEKPGTDERKDGEAKTELRSGDPAVVEMPRHRGRVVLVTSTVNKDWTTWPGSPSFVVFMQSLLRYAVAGRLHDQVALVGEPLEQYLPANNNGLEALLLTPDGRKVRLPLQAHEDTALLRFTDTDQSGLYVATVGAQPREYLFAVNPPTATTTESLQASESDLARTSEVELRSTYPSWEFKVVTDPRNIVHTLEGSSGEGPVIIHGMGAIIARYLLVALFVLLLAEGLLAWRLGRHSSTAGAVPSPDRRLPIAVGVVAGLAFLGLAGILLHTARTDDFLGFLPDRLRGGVESLLGVPQLVDGESTHWRLEYRSYLGVDTRLEPWLIGFLAFAAAAAVVGIYLSEGRTASQSFRLLLAGLRIFLILLVLVVLSHAALWFERQGWPDVAVIVDDSESMSLSDQYRDPRVKEAAEQLAQLAQLSSPQRLQLAQTLLTHPQRDWLMKMIEQRKVKIHVYHCSSVTARLADLTRPDERDTALLAVKDLPREGKYGQTTQLGMAVRTVLKDFNGSSLAGIVMLTDGVTTEGEDLIQASRHAAQAGVPLFFIGLGDAHDRDLILHDLQVEDSVFVNDRLIFEARLTAQGFNGLPPVKVKLYERQANGKLVEVPGTAAEPNEITVAANAQGKPVRLRLVHRPTIKGKKTYVLKAAEQPGEVDLTNNEQERTVNVEEARPSKVLYVEGYPRPEFRFLKTLLEREKADAQGKKTIELTVMLLDADEDWKGSNNVRTDFPATKEEMNEYDVVILGDVDPRHPKLGEKRLKLLVDFVREHGGGLLLIAGKRDNPLYKDMPLADVLPIQVIGGAAAEDPDASKRNRYRPQLTTLGRMHPIFRFSPDEADNVAIWNHLAEIYWFADGYRLQPAAEVLAVHPKQRAADLQPDMVEEKHPLVVQHFVGNGRCLFLGFDETWAWGYRDDVVRYQQFWTQMIHYLARSRLGRIDLRLDHSTAYRKGEPIKVMVRFPDDAQPPKEGTKVEVMVERRPPKDDGPAETESRLQALTRVEGSRATFEALVTPTPEGEYRLWLKSPTAGDPPPQVRCTVLKPPGEMERKSMNQAEIERTAEETQGKFYNLADADKLLDDLPTGARVTLKTPGPPWLLWNNFMIFFLVVGLIGCEWVLRKRKHLL